MLTTLTKEYEDLFRDLQRERGRWAYVPVVTRSGFTLGQAVEGISGYYPTTDTARFKSYEDAGTAADHLNAERMTADESTKIIASTMGRPDRVQIVVVVDGGNVQEVYSSTDNIDVVLVDHDNLREDHDREGREQIEANAVEGLKQVSLDEPEIAVRGIGPA